MRKVHELQNIYRDIAHLKALIPVLAIKEDEPEYKQVTLGFLKLGGEYQVRHRFRKTIERPTDTLFRLAQMIEAMSPQEKQRISKEAKGLLDKLTGAGNQPEDVSGQSNVQPLRASA